jgi:hypothetical protein
VADRIARGERGAFPLVDDSGACVGIVTRRDLLAQSLHRDAPVRDVASRDVVTIGPDVTLAEALRRMVDEKVDHLPVVDSGELVGICTRADLVRAHSDELALERLETGWLAPVLNLLNSPDRRYLVVGNESLGTPALMRELAARTERIDGMSFHVVVPLARGEDLSVARQRLEAQLDLIEKLGARASGGPTISICGSANSSAARTRSRIGMEAFMEPILTKGKTFVA